MSIEQLLADHTAALNAHTAALAAHAAALGAEPKKTRAKKDDAANPTPTAASAPAQSPAAATPSPAATPASAPAAPAAPATAAPGGIVSLKDASDKFSTLARSNRAAAVAILAQFGVERLSMVKPEKLGEVVKAVEAASAPAAAPAPVADSLI